jgi:hypothetical protein
MLATGIGVGCGRLRLEIASIGCPSGRLCGALSSVHYVAVRYPRHNRDGSSSYIVPAKRCIWRRVPVLRWLHDAHGVHLHTTVVPGDPGGVGNAIGHQHHSFGPLSRCRLHHVRRPYSEDWLLYTVHDSGI